MVVWWFTFEFATAKLKSANIFNLQWQFGTQPPSLIFTNISGYMECYLLYITINESVVIYQKELGVCIATYIIIIIIKGTATLLYINSIVRMLAAILLEQFPEPPSFTIYLPNAPPSRSCLVESFAM